MKSLEVFDPTKDLRREFSSGDIIHMRIQYANRLFFHSGNLVDRSIVTNYYVKVSFFFFCIFACYIFSGFVSCFYFIFLLIFFAG
jgi:hypothetical protein